MIRFECDYAEGAHLNILKKMMDTNLEQTPGYGVDCHCDAARGYIKALCGRDDLDIHFLVGGTQSNLTFIASCLRSFQGVIAPHTAHINTHETGAIEATGHKVLTLPAQNGKITAAQVEELLLAHYNDTSREHCVQPGMVNISHPTEYGTIYTKEELYALSRVCKQYDIPLYMDGARLGYALAAKGNDVTFADIAACCDAFYIGGTKIGALFGEAVVIVNPALKKDFRYSIKQRGGMLAKGRLLGIQFEELFSNNLYTELGAHAVRLAMLIKDACKDKGYPFLYDSPTNQQFPVMPIADIEKLNEQFAFYTWDKVDDTHYSVRIITSWATREEDAKALAEAIRNV